MISEKELNNYLENPLKVKAAFNYVGGRYILTENKPGKINIKMEYMSKTDHWLLNSSLAVKTIYEKVAKGTTATLNNIINSSKLLN